MKAIVHHKFGRPTRVLKLEEIEKPSPKDNEILVRVRASSINALEWRSVTGTPYLARPMMGGIFKTSDPRVGVDVAGVVEAVGKDVTEFKPGDEVFGMRSGSLAEYVTATEAAFTRKPKNVSFEAAASVGVAGRTALKGLRDVGKVKPGQQVLINGAGGGVGTFAVQLAKYFGAEVTAVTSTGKRGMVKSIGADHVIDYTKEDFTRSNLTYDVIFDNAADRSVFRALRRLKPDGILVLVGSISKNKTVGPLSLFIKAGVLKRLGKRIDFFMAGREKEDLVLLADLLESGAIKPVIDRTFTLVETPQAVAYVQSGQTAGKVVITV